MSPELVYDVVRKLFAAAGRGAGDAEFDAWGAALEDLDDDQAAELALDWLRQVDLTATPPSPARFRAELVRRRQLIKSRVQPVEAAGPRTAEERANVLRLVSETKDLLRAPDDAEASAAGP